MSGIPMRGLYALTTARRPINAMGTEMVQNSAFLSRHIKCQFFHITTLNFVKSLAPAIVPVVTRQVGYREMR